MITYNNIILELLEGQKHGCTFAALVRGLRGKGHAPSLHEMQLTLHSLVVHAKVYLGKGGLWRSRKEAVTYKGRYTLVAPADGGDGQYVSYAYYEEWGEAWKAAATDWFGDPCEGALVLKRARGGYVPDSKLAAVDRKAPVMPKWELDDIRVKDEEYIKEELKAIVSALTDSLSPGDYKRLRADAVGGKVKLSFAVEVDIENAITSATMSGSIRLKSEGASVISDPRQLLLDFENGKGGSDAR